MRVLDAGDPLDSGFKRTNELRVVGDIGVDHLDHHDSLGEGLTRPVDRAMRPAPDRLDQFIASDPRHRLGEAHPRVVGQDPPLQFDQHRRRIETRFVHHVTPVPLERSDRSSVGARPMKGDHEVPDQLCAVWILGNGCFDVADDLAMLVERDACGEDVLEGGCSQVLQFASWLDRPRFPGKFAEGRTRPQRQRVAERRQRLCRRPPFGGLDRSYEFLRVEGPASEVDQVATGPAQQTAVTQHATDTGHVTLDGPLRNGWVVASRPQRIDNLIERNNDAGAGEQQTQQTALLDTTERDRPVIPGHSDGAKNLIPKSDSGGDGISLGGSVVHVTSLLTLEHHCFGLLTALTSGNESSLTGYGQSVTSVSRQKHSPPYRHWRPGQSGPKGTGDTR